MVGPTIAPTETAVSTEVQHIMTFDELVEFLAFRR
jgi:hypothetical protein